MNIILAVGYVQGGAVHFRVAPPASFVTVTDADVDALIEEVYGKPGLGVMDSAGLFDSFDYDGELEDLIEGMDEEAWIRGGC